MTTSQLRALAWAVRAAETGRFVLADHDEFLKVFDKNLSAARHALSELTKTEKARRADLRAEVAA